MPGDGSHRSSAVRLAPWLFLTASLVAWLGSLRGAGQETGLTLFALTALGVPVLGNLLIRWPRTSTAGRTISGNALLFACTLSLLIIGPINRLLGDDHVTTAQVESSRLARAAPRRGLRLHCRRLKLTTTIARDSLRFCIDTNIGISRGDQVRVRYRQGLLTGTWLAQGGITRLR